MSFNISITSNVVDAISAMGKIPDKVITEATRTAISRTLTSGRKDFSMIVRKRLKTTAKTIKKGTSITKPKRGSLGNLNGSINFDDNPMPILQFIVGHKNPIKQKGIKVGRRRKLKAEIKRGRKIHMMGAFIQKVRTKQVFRRGKGGGLKKQSAPSIGEWSKKPGVQKMTMRKMMNRFDKVLANQVDYRMERLAQKLNSGPMKPAKMF